MNGADNLVNGQPDNQPFDLPPMAEVDVIAHVPAAIRERRGLKSRVVTETGDQLLCIFKRSEEHTSELQSLMRISYAVFCLKKKQKKNQQDILITKTEQNTKITLPYTISTEAK